MNGQITIFEYLNEINKVCRFSKHSCNQTELWKVAHSLDNINCPEVCCRRCDVIHCGARCNGSDEPKEIVYPVDIRGICDDAYCPKCNTELDEFRFKDCDRCPWCGIKIDWTPWHRANDEED